MVKREISAFDLQNLKLENKTLKKEISELKLELLKIKAEIKKGEK